MNLTPTSLKKLNFSQIYSDNFPTYSTAFKLVTNDLSLIIVKEKGYSLFFVDVETFCDNYHDPFLDFLYYEYPVTTVTNIFEAIAEEQFRQGQNHKIREFQSLMTEVK